MVINSPVFILVRPQMGENIGAAARAMLNFGLSDLRIVNPRDGWPNQAAIDMAAGALDDPSTTTLYNSLPDALADCHYAYATTARHRDMVKPVFTARGAAQDGVKRAAEGQKTAFVFGRERTGLENDEVSLCHAVITIPVNPDFSSINLGQAALLLSYEWLMAGDATPDKVFDPGDSFPVEHAKLDEFLSRLENELDEGGFFRSAGLKPTMIRNIRGMFMRGDITDQEVRTLHGVVTTLTGKKESGQRD